jgi:hypothetical protein
MMHIRLLLSAAVLPLVAASASAQEANPVGREAKIHNALTAGPASITGAAAVMDFDNSVLREGTNGWTCFPDFPGTPANDPSCMDEESLRLYQAFLNREEPEVTGIGIAYMLQGDAVASNSDPFATEPPAGQDWQYDPPHLMLISPDPELYRRFPTDPANGGPWVMFANTPYQHIMVPVAARIGSSR